METHDSDPTTEKPIDPWTEVSAEFSDLRRQLKDTYRRVAQDRGPSDEEIKEAFVTLAGAWDQVADSFREAMKDDEVKDQLKETASSFATALGATLSELGAELRKVTLQDDAQSPKPPT